jgi:hypothetical protein
MTKGEWVMLVTGLVLGSAFTLAALGLSHLH